MIQPFGQVPAAVDGDHKLFESRAISQYVAHQYASKGTQLGSADNELATILVWQEVEAPQFDPSASKMVLEQVCKPIFGLPTDAAVVAETEVTLGLVGDPN
ncbi:GLUTATHIONE S-TRANSFERASE F6-RELATED [Salix purpurea]|uniref:glutathione transferase n=1 Tax=Salix purpurea TaxID=77065 RepID=A0A9Q0SKB5_SALPP|nr:GLUTATHIONE S-TRANSFERASE F6-RELATED [Salix purpurea]